MFGAPSLPRPVEPCWYCCHWGGVAESGVNGLCKRDGGKLQAQPEHGCAFSSREPGSDDDGWRPILQGRYDMGKAFAARLAAERAAKPAPRPRQWWEEPSRPRPVAPPLATPTFDLPALAFVTGFENLDE